METLVLTRPDDAHLHLRDGEALAHVIADSARQFGRAVIMPNLVPPIDSVEQANAYRTRITQVLKNILPESNFTPLMALYLTDKTTIEDVIKAKDSPFILSFKLYPNNATTNSSSGVTNIESLYPVFEAMEEYGMILSIHGEITDSNIDIFDREIVFLDRILTPITRHFPSLKVILEHVTTRHGIQFIEESSKNVAGTLTAHHLLLNRNALLVGGIHPHNYCLPILKREADRDALLSAATSGNPKFFLGSDSAPHAKKAKESACGCAGIYTGLETMGWYAEAFESVGALPKLNDFASRFGAEFYGLQQNQDTITLIKSSWQVPEYLPYEKDQILIPFKAGKIASWKLHTEFLS